MIGAFVACISLNLVAMLVNAGVEYRSIAITDATATTPIVVTSPAHGIPPQARVHAVVAGVTGTVEANGLWELTPLDADRFSLASYDAQGLVVDSVGVSPYAGGGTITWPLPDGRILLGRRYKLSATSVVSPRFVMIPTGGPGWEIDPYGGAAPSIVAAEVPPVRGSAEQQSMTLSPQIATQRVTFEVYVNGSGPDFGHALDPDFADFNATQRLAHLFFGALFDALGGRARVLSESWPSQTEAAASVLQRGQQWFGLVEAPMPVTLAPLEFAPIGVRATLDVRPDGAGSSDAEIIVVPPLA